MKTKLLRVSPADEMLASVICVQTIRVNLFVHAYIIYIYIYVAVDGGWDEWSEWTVCSSQCERQRSRECNSPAPRHRGKTCEGNSEATENCTDGLCTQSKGWASSSSSSFSHHHHHVYTHRNMANHHKHVWTGGVLWKRKRKKSQCGLTQMPSAW